MPGGGFGSGSGSGSRAGSEFEAKITPIVIISCIMAATGGLMFGYDVGVSGTIHSFTLYFLIIYTLCIYIYI